MHVLEQQQDLPASVEEVWDFIKTPKNLNAITPDDLDFEFLGDLPDEMYNGLLIRYRIGIPMFGKWNWVTEIKHIREGISFIDEQRFGPYKFWYHYHEVRPIEGGTRMIDRVHYKLPFGPLGEIVHVLQVKGMLNKIFSFRQKKMKELFPGHTEST
ncbi:MAG: SRPBCC family protein [Candidatus Omnitrophica bacterium]|nr:SRPBCC family protein [Candidatus Omnitrophota bacterium]MCA9444515.1 SRPBCC family protein [Candidatus Omnitrophota bacterium]